MDQLLSRDKDDLKNFIIKNKDLINNFQVEDVFNNLLHRSSILDTHGAFSYICEGWIKLGLNPLEKLDTVPSYYTRHIAASEIIVPSNIKSIDFAAFNNSDLDTLIIDSGVERIASHAFYNCNIKSLIIKSQVIDIDEQAFSVSRIEQLDKPSCVRLPYYCIENNDIREIINRNI